jgi:hypothetical protein
MQGATIFSIFYHGISFQHSATVLISVFALLFHDPLCIIPGQDGFANQQAAGTDNQWLWLILATTLPKNRNLI